MVAPLESSLLGGRYRMERSIAAGGMAEVWLAHDTQLDRQVAVKVLKDHSQQDEVVVERFRREAKALALLNHPNIVPVYDIVEHESRLYVVMRYVRGKSLRQVLDEQRRRLGGVGTISVQMTVHIGRSIALALKHAHDANIVHRDVKPANILIEDDGTVLLTDFGIAKTIDSDGESDLTNANIMMGTAKYLAPEQVQGRPLTGQADLYALGLVLYECLAGDVPFKGSNDQAIAIERLQRDPTPLDQMAPSAVPSTLVDVVHQLLRRNPRNRFESGAHVSDALQAALVGSPEAETPVAGGVAGSRSTPYTTVDPLMPTTPARSRRTAPGDHPSRRAQAPTPGRSRNDRRTSDRTPQGAARPRQTLPPKQSSSTLRDLLPVAVLLVIAIAVGALLWNTLRGSGDPSAAAPESNVSIAAITSYDPNGDDGTENEELIPALTDRIPTTGWTTVCYNARYFGSKQGVGVVLRLSEAARGTLDVFVGNAPWQLQIFTSTTGIQPTIEAWGEPVDTGEGDEPEEVSFTIPDPATHVLLLFREAGLHPTCSERNPYKAVLGELMFAAD